MTSALSLSEDDLLDVLSVLDQQDDDASSRAFSPALALAHAPAPSLLLPLDSSLHSHLPLFPASELLTGADAASPDDGLQELLDAGNDVGDVSVPRRRRRPKQDLDETRAAVAALEQQLARLRSSCRAPSELAEFWRRVAGRLRRDRERAVADNARLRALVMEQARVLKAAQRAFVKAAEIARNNYHKMDRDAQRQCVSALVTPLAPYDELLQEITVSFPRLDVVIERVGLDMTIGSASNPYKRHVSARLESTSASERPFVCIEVAESRVVPFGIPFISANVWRYLSSTRRSPKRENAGPQSSSSAWKTQGDDALGKCGISASVGLYDLAGHVAIRRRQPKNRLAFVATGQLVCTHTVDPSESLSLRDVAWFLLEPLPSDPEHSTIVRSFLQYQPASAHDKAATMDLGTLMPIALTAYDLTVAPILNGVMAQLQMQLQAQAFIQSAIRQP